MVIPSVHSSQKVVNLLPGLKTANQPTCMVKARHPFTQTENTTMELTFKQWCELNGRRHIGAATFEEFKKNAQDYEAYLKKTRAGGA